MTSTTEPICVDREVVLTSFRRWEAEQAELDAQLADSVEALAAYQSHLDAWQLQLVQERDELQQLQVAAERDQAIAGAEHERLEQANAELNDARQKISTLTSLLLARTEELRALDHEHGDANSELTVARARELELVAALAAQQSSFDAERQRLQQELLQLRQQPVEAASSQRTTPGETPKSDQSHSESARAANPVLGSVMEQFGKLRQQRSMGRSSPKPR